MASFWPLHLLLNALIMLALFVEPNEPYSYGSGQAQQQQPSPGTETGGGYDNYGRFHGTTGGNGGGGAGRVGPSLEYRVDSDGRRRANSRIPASMDQRQQKKLESANFRRADFCQERCELECQVMMFFTERDNEPEESYHCAKLRPPPKPFHEKIVDGLHRAGLFEFIVGGVLAFAVLICCACSCYQCCCKGRPYPGRRHYDGVNTNIDPEAGTKCGLNGGGTLSTSGNSPERESLNNNLGTHLDDGIHAAPLPDKQKFGTNGGLNGALAQHHHTALNHGVLPHHHQQMPRSNTGGFSSRTHSDV